MMSNWRLIVSSRPRIGRRSCAVRLAGANSSRRCFCAIGERQARVGRMSHGLKLLSLLCLFALAMVAPGSPALAVLDVTGTSRYAIHVFGVGRYDSSPFDFSGHGPRPLKTSGLVVEGHVKWDCGVGTSCLVETLFAEIFAKERS